MRTATGVVSRRHHVLRNKLEVKYEHNIYFACLNSVGRRVRLGQSDAEVGIPGNGGTGMGNFQLGGPYVTFTVSEVYRYVGCVRESVKQYDLRSGKVSLSVTYGAGFGCLRSLAPNEPALVTSAAGYAAVVNEERKKALPEILLVVHDKNGIRTLDETSLDATGSGYPITAIQITGTVIAWEDKGQPHSATLQ